MSWLLPQNLLPNLYHQTLSEASGRPSPAASLLQPSSSCPVFGTALPGNAPSSSLVLRIPSNNSRELKGPAPRGLLTTRDVFSGRLCPGSRSKVRRNPKKTIRVIIRALLPVPPQTTAAPIKRKKKAIIRFRMLTKYAQIIHYISWETTTKENYFLISCAFLFKAGPDTCTSPWESQCRTPATLMANRMFCAGLVVSSRKRPPLQPPLHHPHHPSSLLK